MDLNDKKILITGAAGFVGAVLLRRLVTQYPKAKIYITLREASDTWRIKDLFNRINILYIDLINEIELKKCLTQVKPDIIFHLAVYGAYSKQDSFDLAVQTNIIGTKNLLTALEGIHYQLFVNTGSSSEYGYKIHPMKESDLLEPNSFYSATKGAATLISNTYGQLKNKPVLTIRLFSVYGPYEEPGRLIPSVVMRALDNEPVSVVGKSQVRDFVYVEDVVDVYLACTTLKKFDQRVFNICSGKQTSIQKIAALIVKLADSESKISIGDYTPRPWDTNFWVGDNHLAKEVLGWQPKRTLSNGLLETIEWFKVNKKLYIGR